MTAQGIGKQRARDRDEGSIRLRSHQHGQSLRRVAPARNLSWDGMLGSRVHTGVSHVGR
jgi:hypothetical protein